MLKTLAAMSPMGLKARVLLLVSGILILCVWGLAVRVAAVAQADIEKTIADQLSGTVAYAATDLDHEISLRIDVLSKMAAAISPGMLPDPLKLQHFLEEHYLSSLLFPTGVFVANKQGIETAVFPIVPGRKGGFIGDRDYFLDVMASGKPVISRPVAGRFLKKPIVVVAVPLKDALGATVGLLGGALLLSDENLLGRLEQTKIGKTSFFMVESPKHRLFVFTTDENRILTPLPARGVNPLMDRRLDQGFVGTAINKNSRGIETLSVAHKMESTGWITIAGISTDEAFMPVTRLKQQIYLAALWISLVVVLILFLALKRLLAPLDEAATTMGHMTDGEIPLAEIPVKRNDEIGNVVGNFNRLVRGRLLLEEQMRTMNEELEQHVAERTQELRIMTRSYVNVQESEKRRLARELHDKVSSNLTAINLNLGLIESLLPQAVDARVCARLSDTVALVKETMSSTRNISADLHPAVLDYGGVLHALQDYGRNFMRRTGIAVEVLGNDEELRYTPEKEIALYRIALEALTNCLKHAGAHSVTIELNSEGERNKLTISDDGSGFEPAALTSGENPPGLGLLSMRERAEAIGGKLFLAATPGKGTRITVEF